MVKSGRPVLDDYIVSITLLTLATAPGTFDAIPSTIIQPCPLTPSPTRRTPSMPTSEGSSAPCGARLQGQFLW